MLRHYLKIGLRNLSANKGYSLINVVGLSTGITVAILTGLWVYDELSFNKYHDNINEIGQIWGGSTNPETSLIEGSTVLECPVASILQADYQHYFKHVVHAGWIENHVAISNDKHFNLTGQFIDGTAIEMLSLKMLSGNSRSLDDPHSIILSQSAAHAFFGKNNPINKNLKVDGNLEVLVRGVFEDIPKNSTFGEVQFFSPWSLWESSNDRIRQCEGNWGDVSFLTYVQLQPNISMIDANAAIKDFYYKYLPADYLKTIEKNKPFLQVFAMSKWHLYSEFKNGIPVGGRIKFVLFFGVVGGFVLALACINFVNLSTARSERRSKEVGIRKAVGSVRWQLMCQFMMESFSVVSFASAVSLVSVTLLRGKFNQLAAKNISLPFDSFEFWMVFVLFIAFVSFLSGLYPAFYLSSFRPVKALKGIVHADRSTVFPRKILIVFQFTISLVLIAGAVIVFQQVEYAQSRPLGFDTNGIVSLEMNDHGYKGKQDVLKSEFMNSGVVHSVAFASSPLTDIWNTTGGYSWEGRHSLVNAWFRMCEVTFDYGRTAGWQVVSGRDFNEDMATDSSNSLIINEAAARYMGLKDPVGKEIVELDEFGVPQGYRTIVGVVRDMVMESPYDQVKQTLYSVNKRASNIMLIKISSGVKVEDALTKIKVSLQNVIPSAVFDYKFVDQVYAKKFSEERRIGVLASIYSTLAIMISCLGIFGLASHVVELRTKEIGIRKAFGATVLSLWKMISSEFVMLVVIAFIVASPIEYWLMSDWLGKFEYRTEITWWSFPAIFLSALMITLFTVSFQSVRAAMSNPVKALRSE